jgi:hypothetical protein
MAFTACEDLLEDDEPETSLEDISGQWLRVESNNDPADGIIINVENGEAVIIDAANANFDVNDILWINITPDGADSFNLEVLGSDGNYYESSMVLVDRNEISLSIAAAGSGNEQTWQRLTN